GDLFIQITTKRHYLDEKAKISPTNILLILYKSNRYSVPLGTYNKQKDVYISAKDGYLFIYASENGLLLAKHKISNGKGQLIQDTQHTRDRSKGIDALLETVASYFDEYELAKSYLVKIRTKYPRYVRDQFQMIIRCNC